MHCSGVFVVSLDTARQMTPRTLSVAREILAEFESRVGRLKPPIPVGELAAWLGFQVIFLHSVPDEFSALVSTREKLIGINATHHRHRQRFSLGHELAHILLRHPPEGRCDAKQIARYNREADECAAELLIPTPLLVPVLAEIDSSDQLARIFDVSVEAMERKRAWLEKEMKESPHESSRHPL